MNIWLQLCQILTHFSKFCSDKTGKMYKNGMHSRMLTSCASVWSLRGANWTSLLWTTPLTSACVGTEGGHFEHYLWLLLSKCQCQNGNTVNLIIGDDFFCSLLLWIVAFLTEKCCYLNLQSKVCTQLRWCGKFYYSHM